MDIKLPVLKVQMLGGLSLMFGEEPISFSRNTTTKAMKLLQMTPQLAAKHYAEHVGREDYEGLASFMTSAPLMAMVLRGEDAIERVRQLNGVTDPAKAMPGTIRHDFAESTRHNAVHASDGPESAVREIHIFFNEEEVGSAIKKSGVPREEIFLTTKVWIENYGYDECQASIEESMRKLQTDYLDLLLLHQPFADYYGAWRALEEYYEAGKIRAIGISNFYPDRMIDIATFARIKPMINQVEMVCMSFWQRIMI